MGDYYPKEAFELMLLLRQETKALGLAELLTRQEYKSRIFILIASHLARRPGREREAIQLFARSELVMLSISDELDKAQVLRELVRALSQAGLWQEAERVIGSISYEERKAHAQTELATALSQAGFWKEAEGAIDSISNGKEKIKALDFLVTELAQHSQHSWVISIIQREWLNSVSRDDAFNRFPLVFSLIPYYPDLGMQLYDTFAWVDSFLQG